MVRVVSDVVRVVMPRGRPRWWRLALLPLALLIGSCLPEPPDGGWPPERGTAAVRPDPALLIHFLDVGQGDAVVLQLPDGRAVLYDGGPSPDRALRELDRLGVDSVELVIASHPHLDHIGGLIDVIRRHRPTYVIDNRLPHTTRTYQRFLEAVAGSGAQLLEPVARTISLGDVTLRILEPPGEGAWGLNDNSVGVLVDHGTFTMVLAGDAERAQWHWWLGEGVLPQGPVAVHKASHHGSRNGDTAEAINLLGPAAVVIGVGANNQYGHPHREALDLYRGVGAEIFRTDLDGTVTVEVQEGGAFEIRTGRR